MISYLCRALRLSQIVLNVGAAAAVAGFFADFAVGGGLVGLAFFGLFNVKVSVKVSGKVSSGTTPFADSGRATRFLQLSIVRGLVSGDEGDLTQSDTIGVQCCQFKLLQNSS